MSFFNDLWSGTTGVWRAYADAVRTRQPARFNTTFHGQPLTLQVAEAPIPDDKIESLPVAALWRTQPHLRTVVGYIASNVSQLNLHVFAREESGDRERVQDGALVELLRRPNGNATLSEFLYGLVTQMALYDDAFVLVLERETGTELRVIPNQWVTVHSDAFGQAESYEIAASADNAPQVVGADQVLRFPGWSPDNPARSTSPVETLRLILAEQAQSMRFRQQVWSRSGRFTGWISRPKDAPHWDDQDRQRFYKMFEAFTGPNGARAGENPLLEDGMELKTNHYTARDEQWAEATKISLETVCQVYHVPPVMIGITDDANYSNVTAYQRQLYTNTLASWLTKIEQRLNQFLLPMLGAPDNVFVEFNIEGKLRGDFAEQYKILQTAVGAPFLTRNEARRVLNYKPVDHGDELITPLNVLEGGQASPTDAGEGRPDEGAGSPEYPKDFNGIVAKTLERAQKTVTARRNAGRADWWTPERWERELTTDLVKDAGVNPALAGFLATQIVTKAGEAYQAGAQPDPVPIIEEVRACLSE